MNVIRILKDLLSGGSKLGKFVITERIITALTRTVDVLMIYFIWTDPGIWGLVKCFLFVTPVYLAFCGLVVYISDQIHSKGFDVTGIEELRKIADKKYEKKQYIKRFASWTLRRRLTIFWVGSWFYLDPDYVTLLLRDKTKGFWYMLFTITLPSVLCSMIVWTSAYWLACRGVEGAQWLIEYAP